MDYRAKYIDYLETELVRVRDERDAYKAELFKHYGVGNTETSVGPPEDLKPVSGVRPSWAQVRFQLEDRRRREAAAMRTKRETPPS